MLENYQDFMLIRNTHSSVCNIYISNTLFNVKMLSASLWGKKHLRNNLPDSGGAYHSDAPNWSLLPGKPSQGLIIMDWSSRSVLSPTIWSSLKLCPQFLTLESQTIFQHWLYPLLFLSPSPPPHPIPLHKKATNAIIKDLKVLFESAIAQSLGISVTLSESLVFTSYSELNEVISDSGLYCKLFNIPTSEILSCGRSNWWVYSFLGTVKCLKNSLQFTVSHGHCYTCNLCRGE